MSFRDERPWRDRERFSAAGSLAGRRRSTFLPGQACGRSRPARSCFLSARRVKEEEDEKDIACSPARGVPARRVRGGARTPRLWRSRGAASSVDRGVGRRTLLPSQRLLLLLPERPLVLLKLKERTLGGTAKGPLPDRGQGQGQGERQGQLWGEE